MSTYRWWENGRSDSKAVSFRLRISDEAQEYQQESYQENELGVHQGVRS